MPETIPLRTYLSIKCKDIVIDHTIRSTSLTNFVLKKVSTKARVESSVERPVERDADS